MGIGGIIALLSLSSFATAQQQTIFGPNTLGTELGLVGVFIGIVVGGLGFIFGVMVSAQGQLLKAILDTAVNSSPLLDDDQRARMMSL